MSTLKINTPLYAIVNPEKPDEIIYSSNSQEKTVHVLTCWKWSGQMNREYVDTLRVEEFIIRRSEVTPNPIALGEQKEGV
jgi:hypothetical protein